MCAVDPAFSYGHEMGNFIHDPVTEGIKSLMACRENKNTRYAVRFWCLVAVVMKFTALRHVTPCSLLDIYRYLKGIVTVGEGNFNKDTYFVGGVEV